MAVKIIKGNQEYRHDFPTIASTTNATVTTLLTVPITADSMVNFKYTFSGTVTDFSAAIGGDVFNVFRRVTTGDIVRAGTEKSTINKDTALITCDCYIEIDNTGHNLLVRVKGKTATNIDWVCETDYLAIY